jgi:hypothetical protein
MEPDMGNDMEPDMGNDMEPEMGNEMEPEMGDERDMNKDTERIPSPIFQEIAANVDNPAASNVDKEAEVVSEPVRKPINPFAKSFQKKADAVKAPKLLSVIQKAAKEKNALTPADGQSKKRKQGTIFGAPPPDPAKKTKPVEVQKKPVVATKQSSSAKTKVVMEDHFKKLPAKTDSPEKDNVENVEPSKKGKELDKGFSSLQSFAYTK